MSVGRTTGQVILAPNSDKLCLWKPLLQHWDQVRGRELALVDLRWGLHAMHNMMSTGK